MDLDRIMTKVNPWIVRLLASRCHGIISRGLMVVYVVGHRTGKQYSIPVGYQRKENVIIVLVSKSRRKNWWRNYGAETPINLLVRGKAMSGMASLVDKKSDAFKDYINTTFRRLPGLSKQFGVSQLTPEGVANQDWPIVELEAEIVFIRL